ncbi:MAG: hypothetical protein D6681_16345, partial [Calditrichaeota bacterium]
MRYHTALRLWAWVFVLAVCGSLGFARESVSWARVYGTSDEASGGKVYLIKQEATYQEPSRISPDYHLRSITERQVVWSKTLG